MGIYPPKVQQFAAKPGNGGRAVGENAAARDASFVCGSFVGFSIAIDDADKSVVSVKFQTNGCGFMIAAADVLCDTIKGRHLSQLHGLDEDELRRDIESVTGPPPHGRRHCIDTCIAAMRSAFADYRSRQLEEFSGEKALICTCFGVTEETVERHISQGDLTTVDEVTSAARAGGGCGSCRMLIQEMLDIHQLET